MKKRLCVLYIFFCFLYVFALLPKSSLFAQTYSGPHLLTKGINGLPAILGRECNGDTFFDFSEDGRYFTFSTAFTNLVEGDTNKANDIVRFDFTDESFVRVSVTNEEEQFQFSKSALLPFPTPIYAGCGSHYAQFFGDSQKILFMAENPLHMVTHEDPASGVYFLRDIEAGTTEVVNLRENIGRTPITNGKGHLEYRFPMYRPTVLDGGNSILFQALMSDLTNEPLTIFSRIVQWHRPSKSLLSHPKDSFGVDFETQRFLTTSRDGRFITFEVRAMALLTEFPEFKDMNPYEPITVILDTVLGTVRFINGPKNISAFSTKGSSSIQYGRNGKFFVYTTHGLLSPSKKNKEKAKKWNTIRKMKLYDVEQGKSITLKLNKKPHMFYMTDQISDDGNYILLFDAYNKNKGSLFSNLYLHNVSSGETTIVSKPSCYGRADCKLQGGARTHYEQTLLSPNGKVVVFKSTPARHIEGSTDESIQFFYVRVR